MCIDIVDRFEDALADLGFVSGKDHIGDRAIFVV